jgi:hypothetical protein
MKENNRRLIIALRLKIIDGSISVISYSRDRNRRNQPALRNQKRMGAIA